MRPARSKLLSHITVIKHYKTIFDYAPIAIIERDFKPILKLKKALQEKGITRYRTYLRTHRRITNDAFRSSRILHANKSALEIFGAKNKKELNQKFNKTFHSETFLANLRIIASVMEGQREFSVESKCQTMDGKVFDVFIKVHVPKLYEKNLKRAIITLEDISVQKKYERHLKRLAQTDGLTRVMNNGTAMERLQEEFLRAKRYKNDLSIMMIDLDHFKKINDKYGHQKGDTVLRSAALIIKDNLREVDLIGRYGGDEFIIILPETPAKSAKIAGERIRKIFDECVRGESANEIVSTVSVGISGYNSKGVSTIKELIRTADRALYYAKTAGRNRVIIQ